MFKLYIVMVFPTIKLEISSFLKTLNLAIYFCVVFSNISYCLQEFLEKLMKEERVSICGPTKSLTLDTMANR